MSQDKSSEGDNDELDGKLIDQSLNQSKQKLNISFQEKEDLEDIDDDEIEKQFTEFIQEINRPEEQSIFKKLSSVLDQGFLDEESKNEDALNFDEFSNKILE